MFNHRHQKNKYFFVVIILLLVIIGLLIFLIVTGGTNSEKQTKSSSKTTQTTKISKESLKTIPQTMSSQQNSSTRLNEMNYTESEKRAITNEFLLWASKRAEIGGMAVTTRFFDHGASGKGDWYALTPDRQAILVQRQDSSRQNSYSIQALGGVTFYTSKDGTLGRSDKVMTSALAAGYNEVADLGKPIIKYLLGDDGEIYEYHSSGSFTDGFYEMDDKGNRQENGRPIQTFTLSADTAAKKELQRILLQYNRK